MNYLLRMFALWFAIFCLGFIIMIDNCHAETFFAPPSEFNGTYTNGHLDNDNILRDQITYWVIQYHPISNTLSVDWSVRTPEGSIIDSTPTAIFDIAQKLYFERVIAIYHNYMIKIYYFKIASVPDPEIQKGFELNNFVIKDGCLTVITLYYLNEETNKLDYLATYAKLKRAI